MKKFLIAICAIFPQIVLAGPPPGGGLKLENYLKFKSVPCLISAILDVVVQIGSLVLVVFIVLTGLKFVTAKGNESQLTEAKQALLWTIIGAAIVLGAFVISRAVEGTVTQLGPTIQGQSATCNSSANQ